MGGGVACWEGEGRRLTNSRMVDHLKEGVDKLNINATRLNSKETHEMAEGVMPTAARTPSPCTIPSP